jgi:hypothetical protein
MGSKDQSEVVVHHVELNVLRIAAFHGHKLPWVSSSSEQAIPYGVKKPIKRYGVPCGTE